MCASCSAPDGAPFRLSGAAGTYSTGSGALGLAVVATLRDSGGHPAPSRWTGALLQGGSPVVSGIAYAAGESGSVQAWWWPDVPASGGDEYLLRFDDCCSPSHYETSLVVPEVAPLGIAQAEWSDGGIRWPAIPGAKAYACDVYGQGTLQLQNSGASTACDVSALPPGSYTATVLALSADLAAIDRDPAQAPAMPAAFEVSESTLAFTLSEGSPGAQLRAAGGPLNYGASTPALALWVSIAQLDGSPSAVSWRLEITGPGIPAAAPLRIDYPASAPRQLLWSYDAPATPGVYSVIARSTVDGGTAPEALSSRFIIGAVPMLPLPSNVITAGKPSGAATFTWDAVPGAASYLVRAFDEASLSLAASAWVVAPGASFPIGTFTSGRHYNVYVAAATADLVDGGAPEPLSASENTYSSALYAAP